MGYDLGWVGIQCIWDSIRSYRRFYLSAQQELHRYPEFFDILTEKGEVAFCTRGIARFLYQRIDNEFV